MTCYICGENLDYNSEVIPVRKMKESSNRIFLCTNVDCWNIWCEMRDMYNDL